MSPSQKERRWQAHKKEDSNNRRSLSLSTYPRRLTGDGGACAEEDGGDARAPRGVLGEVGALARGNDINLITTTSQKRAAVPRGACI